MEVTGDMRPPVTSVSASCRIMECLVVARVGIAVETVSGKHWVLVIYVFENQVKNS